jgi:hypothetical protein
MIEGSGSVILTIEAGSRRPKNIRIQIPITGSKGAKLIKTAFLPLKNSKLSFSA